MKKSLLIFLLLAAGITRTYCQVDPYIGEIRMVTCAYPPRGWAVCDGQLMQINQHQLLYSLIGTTYGGNGTTNFALPDLRGRLAMDEGNGNTPGQNGGSETVPLSANSLPAHSHSFTNVSVTENGNSGNGSLNSPSGNYPARNPTRGNEYSTQSTSFSAPTTLPSASLSMTSQGGGLAHANMAPYTVVYFIICLEGIYPQRP